MLEYEVASLQGVAAAVKAAAQPTYDEAKQNPVQIVFGRTRYTFREGIHARRAEAIARNIRRAQRGTAR